MHLKLASRGRQTCRGLWTLKVSCRDVGPPIKIAVQLGGDTVNGQP